jgi:hypothetical protein
MLHQLTLKHVLRTPSLLNLEVLTYFRPLLKLVSCTGEPQIAKRQCPLKLLSIKSNAIHVQAWAYPEHSRKLRRPELLDQCFSTAGPRPGAGPWHQLYRATSGSAGICHFSFLSIFRE